jgi:hypothetical protein
MNYFKLCLFLIMVIVLSTAQADWLKTLEDFTNAGADPDQANLSNSDIEGAFKDALTIGSENVVNQLGMAGGFNEDSNIRISLPDSLQPVKSSLDKFGMGGSLTDLESRLNEAAESAVGQAQPLFLNAINEMSWADAREILSGPDDSATQYFKNKMSTPLAESMKPIVDESLNEVGAIKSYNLIMEDYSSLPFAPDVQANLTDHVLEKSIDGVFYYMALEEKAIREDPARRTTELLKKVFAK